MEKGPGGGVGEGIVGREEEAGARKDGRPVDEKKSRQGDEEEEDASLL